VSIPKSSALVRAPVFPPAANKPEAYPKEPVFQPGPSLASLWASAGLIRTDITRGFNGLSGAADGAPLDLHLRLLSLFTDQQPLSRYAVYVWHADAAGEYSVFNRPDTNYLRGIGITDQRGRVNFRTVYPGTYRGRPPHIHFEVYRSLDTLGLGVAPLIRSSILFPDMVSRSVYTRNPAYADSLDKYAALRFQLPVLNPTGDKRAVQLASTSASSNSTLRASLDIFINAEE